MMDPWSAAQRPWPECSSAVPSAASSEETEAPETEALEATATPRPRPVSLPALFAREYDGRGLRLRGVIARTDATT